MFDMFYHGMAFWWYVAWNITTIIFYGCVLGAFASALTCCFCCWWWRPRVVAPPAVAAPPAAIARPARRANNRANNHW